MKKTLLFLIILVAIFFRFYQLGSVPPSPSLDEVSVGFNAYSILKTGRDEFGNKLPILLRAYDDWRPALYVYLTIPFVKVFGLNELSVRLPSFVLSLVSLVTFYFLAKEIFGRPLPAIAMLLLGISPWHIYLSRLGHEVNAGLTFFLLGIYFFLKAIKSKQWFFYLSALFFSLSFYTYQSQKIFVPLFLVSLFLIFRKKLILVKKGVIGAALVGMVIFVPILITSLSSEGKIRFQATSLFSHLDEVYQRSSSRISLDYKQKDYLGLVLDNRRLMASQAALQSYLTHFDPRWLYLNNGEEKHKVPSLGLFFLWELPLFIWGAYRLTKSDLGKENKKLIFWWLVLSPIPGSITTQAPHAMRSFTLLPVFLLIEAFGLVNLFPLIKKYLLLIVVVLILSLTSLFHDYFIIFPFEQSDSFQISLKNALNFAQEEGKSFPKIVVTNKDQGYQSYMFYLFYSRYDPQKYLSEGGTVSGGYNETHLIGNYEFRPIDWSKEAKTGGVLYLGNKDDFPKEVMPAATFKNLKGEEKIYAVD